MRTFKDYCDNGLICDLNELEKDIIYVSLLCHDCCKRGIVNKHGEFKNTLYHGAYGANHIKSCAYESDNVIIKNFIKTDIFNSIYNCIYYHNGNFIFSCYHQ